MSQSKWERMAALSGVALGALVALRTLITPKPIPGADPVAFFTDNQSVFLLGVFMTGLIGISGTWFYAGVRSYLDRHGEGRLGTVAFGAWIIVATIAMVRHGMLAVPPMAPETAADTAVLMGLLASVLLCMVWMASFMTAAAMAVAGARSGSLPMWFVGVSALAAVLFFVGGLGLLIPTGYLSPIGDFKTVVLWGFVIWAIAGSVALFQKVGAETAEGTSEAAA